MGAKQIFFVLFILWFPGLTGWLFCSSLIKFRRWRRDTPVSARRQAVLILLPSLLIVLFLLPAILSIPGELPVPQSELEEVTAPVESVKQLTYRRTRGRYGGTGRAHRYHIYLEDRPGYLRIPDFVKFDQDAFLNWAGKEPVTFLFSSSSGRPIPYVIQNASGGTFQDYESVYTQMWSNAVHTMITVLSSALFLGAGAVCLPAWLYPLKARGRIDQGKRRELALLVLFLVVLLAVCFFNSLPEVTETPASSPSATADRYIQTPPSGSQAAEG